MSFSSKLVSGFALAVFVFPTLVSPASSPLSRCHQALSTIALYHGEYLPDQATGKFSDAEIVEILKSVPWDRINWEEMLRHIDVSRPLPEFNTVLTQHDLASIFGIPIGFESDPVKPNDLARIRTLLARFGKLIASGIEFDSQRMAIRDQVREAFEDDIEARYGPSGIRYVNTRYDLLADFVRRKILIFAPDNPELAASWAMADIRQKPNTLTGATRNTSTIAVTRSLVRAWAGAIRATATRRNTFRGGWHQAVADFYRIVLNAKSLTPAIAEEDVSLLIFAQKFWEDEPNSYFWRAQIPDDLPEKYQEILVRETQTTLRGAQIHRDSESDKPAGRVKLDNGVTIGDLSRDVLSKIVSAAYVEARELEKAHPREFKKSRAGAHDIFETLWRRGENVEEHDVIQIEQFFTALSIKAGADFADAYRRGLEMAHRALSWDIRSAREQLWKLYTNLATTYDAFLDDQDALETFERKTATPAASDGSSSDFTKMMTHKQHDLLVTKRDQSARQFARTYLRARTIWSLLNMGLSPTYVELYRNCPIIQAMAAEELLKAEKEYFSRTGNNPGGASDARDALARSIAANADALLTGIADQGTLTAKLVSSLGKAGAISAFVNSRKGKLSTAIGSLAVMTVMLWGNDVVNWITTAPGNFNINTLTDPSAVSDQDFEKEAEKIFEKLISDGLGSANYHEIEKFFNSYSLYDWNQHPDIKQRLDRISRNGIFSKHSILFYGQVRYGSLNRITALWSGGRNKYRKEAIEELGIILKAMRIARKQDHDRFKKSIAPRP